MSKPLPAAKILRVKQLLRDTEMSYEAIARRVNCGHTSVLRINQASLARKNKVNQL